MKKRYIALIILAISTAGAGAAAYILSPKVHSGQPGEAPELGLLGAYRVGTIVDRFTLNNRSQITLTGAATGALPVSDRSLSVRIWYPAKVKNKAEPARYSHPMQLPGKEPLTITTQGVAIPQAEPINGKKFPLIIMSHGFGAWSTHYSNLGEHIASHGYVVASIDHADQPAASAPGFLISFANVLADRAQDQRQLLDKIIGTAAKAAAVNGEAGPAGVQYAAIIDTQQIGVIGYSMGGYGALGAAGAAYDYDSSVFARMPKQSADAMKAAAKNPSPIKAIVAIAPWGGAPGNRAWSAASLAKITQPVLMIAGNQDDIVNFKDGVQWIFNSLTASERYMLVYREARHNVAGNEFTIADNSGFSTLEFLREPVWRTDRINSINQHFVTAFLDRYLKGDMSKAAYLNLPVVNSNKSNWPIGFGEQLNGKRAGAAESGHWRGFPRRWAVGLEMHRKAKMR